MAINRIGVVLLTLIYIIKAQAQDNFCGIRNTAFQGGEQIFYNVYYTLAGIYVNAGQVTFTTLLEQWAGRPVYHIVGEGGTRSSYDWIYKVRDRYESYLDTATLLPVRFVRNVSEGSDKKFEQVIFNRSMNMASNGTTTYQVPPCVQDVLSAIYYARNINFDRYQPNEKIPFSIFLENEVHNVYVRYLGRERVKTKYGTFTAIKFKPLLIKGTIFEGGEKMTVWVTDDANRIPVRVDSPILVGTVRAELVQFKQLRYPLLSLKSRNQ
ncbi:MAG: DUF3108 domain-containing protein [Flavisolibacter sp.]|nr:DUF3108 domain-containing protein [Flavisolibacter sp.]